MSSCTFEEGQEAVCVCDKKPIKKLTLVTKGFRHWFTVDFMKVNTGPLEHSDDDFPAVNQCLCRPQYIPIILFLEFVVFGDVYLLSTRVITIITWMSQEVSKRLLSGL